MNKAEYFVSQWGWEQTNVTFYKVLKRTACYVTVVEVKSERKFEEWGSYAATPIDEQPEWAKVMKKKIHHVANLIDRNMEYIELDTWSHAYIWDGKPVEGTNYA